LGSTAKSLRCWVRPVRLPTIIISETTGREIDRPSKILETYPPRTSRMAENAIAKLEEYKERRKLEA
jgi:hypothetical protein